MQRNNQTEQIKDKKMTGQKHQWVTKIMFNCSKSYVWDTSGNNDKCYNSVQSK